MNEGGEDIRRCKILYDEEIIEQARHATSIVEDEDKGAAEPGGGQLPPSPSYLTQLEVTPIPSNDILSLIALPPRFLIPTTVSVLDDDDDGAG